MSTNSRKRHLVEVPKKRITYDSLKSVLLHMEANKRFEVTRHMPSIRNVEKLVPLTIKRLSFDRFKVEINEKLYQLGIIREFQEDHNPSREIDKENQTGGADYDFDEFGFHEISDDMIVTPGDVQMEHEGFKTKHTKEDSERELRSYANFKPLRYHSNRSYVRNSELTQGRIHLFQCHVNGTPPPYTAFLQLTVEKDYEDRIIERAPYNTKLYLAMKSLTTQLFGNRPHPILVKVFRIESPVRMTIRLPVGVKFHIQHLQLPQNIARCLNELDPIIHESSYPLDQLTISVGFSVDDFKHTGLQNAKKLVIIDGEYDFEDVFKLLPMNSHMIHDSRFSNIAVELVAFWLETHKPIGFLFTVGFVEEQDAIRILNLIGEEEEFKFEVKEERLLVIPINDTSRIKISVEVADAELLNSYIPPWIVKFEVVPA